MGKRTPSKPDACASIDAMIRASVACQAWCPTCKGWKVVDLPALAIKIGGHRSLWGRRTDCRITPGCQGKASFQHDFFGKVFMPMRG